MTDAAKKAFPRVTDVPTKAQPVACVMTVEVEHTAEDSHVYRVVAVKNSLDYEAGEILSDDEMAALVGSPNWDVFVTQPRARTQVVGG
jgi:hypothetical protein